MIRGRQMLTQDRLKQLLHYNPDTGVFTRLLSTSKRTKIGKPVGFINNKGYLCVCIDYKQHLLHRLAWFYMFNILPNVIDHINQIRTDNRISNLRNTTYQVNAQNTSHARPYNSTKLLGVSIRKSGQITAQIYNNNKQIHLGSFETIEDAHQEYLRAKRLLHEGCTI
jgi:hypothetical protein